MIFVQFLLYHAMVSPEVNNSIDALKSYICTTQRKLELREIHFFYKAFSYSKKKAFCSCKFPETDVTIFGYLISSNKRAQDLFNFEALMCGAYWRVAPKEGGAYFKGRGIIHIKFQNFVIFFLKIAKNNCLYVIQCYLFQNY